MVRQVRAQSFVTQRRADSAVELDVVHQACIRDCLAALRRAVARDRPILCTVCTKPALNKEQHALGGQETEHFSRPETAHWS
jgi:hypothetical protein